MKFSVTTLGFQEIGGVNMVFAKTPNGNAPKRRTEIRQNAEQKYAKTPNKFLQVLRIDRGEKGMVYLK